MRPMTATSANYNAGAFSPASITRKPADTRLREDARHQHLVPSIRGDGRPSPADGSFIDYDKTKYGINRFFKTRPQVGVPLYPVMPQAKQAVTNPQALNKKPGYTNNLDVVSTALSQMVNKPYKGQIGG